MRFVLFTFCLLLMFASCEPYEPVMNKKAVPLGDFAEELVGGKMNTAVQRIMADASGAEYVLYFASDTMKFAPMYQGTAPYTANIEIPEQTPLDLWLVTVPSNHDTVRLHVGCIQIKAVNRIRMVVKE